ncbi:GNAT family N-acetyltransferase [Pseudohalocynthiibacter aestuariivivens]|uniref:GNAT family N-acetyltransferase n=1 Tax=Pseudohalocynthiibacter aestuariivivens TaxID=1591409 RepID=A0ABV5JHG1_9RHOB|nr:GNAT family N-acetyltransferase [Pseudohalocynthiibacter aestuariivivens]MBS9715404.1 N-acetyltransferase [Pseudohalocynthiibacter aestuariivivens]
MSNQQIEIHVLTSLSDISEAEWDACACPESNESRPIDPFTTHRFLKALEDSGSVGTGTGWTPRYLVAYSGEMAIAVTPAYAKTHSQGEYVFDYSWAHAYERAGGRYYPKLQISVPFTPATGRRFLARPGYEEMGQSALVQGAVQLASENQLSSLHITYCTEAEAEAGRAMGLLHRTSQQFHWENTDYANFDAFLASLAARKRKNIRKERATAQTFGGTIHQFTGDQIEPEHWDAFWTFYQDTGARKWGTPYLTRAFFDIAQETLRDDILLVLAERNGRWIAGAMNMIGKGTLYGRYWGCTEDHACLHFELCYYQAIDYAITHGQTRVEAGAQGDHKLARGYLPVTTHSLHWIADPGFANAVEKYLVAEREAVDNDIDVLTSYGPFKKSSGEEK